jgi:hypothetical protein
MPFEEFVIDGTTYVLSRDAACAVHLTLDYISRLAKERRVVGDAPTCRCDAAGEALLPVPAH